MINVRLKKINGLASAYLMRQQREKHDSAIGLRHQLLLPSVSYSHEKCCNHQLGLSYSHSGSKKGVPQPQRLLRNQFGELLTAVSNAVGSDEGQQGSHKPA